MIRGFQLRGGYASLGVMSEPMPKEIQPHDPDDLKMAWDNGEVFTIPYRELRFLCPCAVCVDERTGERVIQREHVPTGIRPKAMSPVGRYAIQISWNDGHSTGIYPFERLYHICEKHGSRL